MEHPRRFEPDDPLLARLRAICPGLPGATEKISHGHPVFVTTKQFAVFGGSVKGDHSSDRHARAAVPRGEGAREPHAVATENRSPAWVSR